MSRTNFRVKVDLSKYYHDARRFSWIFIDGTKISQIFHIKEHITKLFNIPEPYHLCLNDMDYLPPNEDARIVKENETIFILPGSGLEEEDHTSINSAQSYVQNIGYNDNKGNKMFYDKEAQTIEFSATEAALPIKDNNPQANGFLSDSKQDTSSVDVTFHSIINETEGNSDTDFKTMESNVTEDHSVKEEDVVSTKRKRIRQRKGKKKVMSFVESTDNGASIRKPKIIDSMVISSGKHIRFNVFESSDVEAANEITNDLSTDDQCAMKSSPWKELSTLLALRYSSTPLTFPNKQIKEEIVKSEETSDKEEKKTKDCSTTNENLSSTLEKSTSDKEDSFKLKNQSLTDTEFKTYPPVTSDAQSNDIIAFKILNFGKDYSPQVSKPIIAQVISSSQQNDILNLKILKGLDEVHFENVPLGKFSIEGEKETVTTDIININYAQMIEPRFIKRSSSTGRVNTFC